MFLKNTPIAYPLLLIMSNVKRSFEGLGKLISKSGDTVKRLLPSKKLCIGLTQRLAQYIFKEDKELIVAIDDSLLKKIFSQLMQGSGRFFDTKIGRCITAYRLIVGAVTNGKYTIPIDFGFLYAKELLTADDEVPSKSDFVKQFILSAQELFPGKKIKFVADGLFTSVEILGWCKANNIEADLRMHSNRVVEFKGSKQKISTIKELIPKGRQMARTIQVTWHNLELDLTADRRIDKHGKESIVYIISTYKARPIQHVSSYNKRWPIEKFFRTSKQSLGIEQCFSTKLNVQEQHVATVLLAYSLSQLKMKAGRFDITEDALRAIKQQSLGDAIKYFDRFDQIFGIDKEIYA